MAVYCTNCGAPLNQGAGFCISCGTAVKSGPVPQPAAASPVTPVAAPAVAPQAPAPAVAKKSSPLLKIVIICLVIFFVLGAMGIIGSIYVAYRLKKSVTEAARNRGVDLSAFSESAQYKGRMPDPCSLLTTGEASQILGVTIERAEAHGHSCDYYAQPVSAEQKQEQMKKAMEEMQAKAKALDSAGGKPNPEDVNKTARDSGLEELTKQMVGSVNTGNGPYFTVELNDNGKAAIAAMKIAMGAVAPGMKTSESLPGIGDEAIIGPMDSMMVFTKNGLGVQIDLRQIPKGRDHAVAMAQRMLGRL